MYCPVSHTPTHPARREGQLLAHSHSLSTHDKTSAMSAREAAEAAATGPGAGKSKVAMKTGGAARQWDILKMIGITEEEIPKFQDPDYWLQYFPDYCVADQKQFFAEVKESSLCVAHFYRSTTKHCAAARRRCRPRPRARRPERKLAASGQKGRSPREQ